MIKTMKKVYPYENPETEVIRFCFNESVLLNGSPNGIDPVPEDDDPFNFD